MADEQGYPPSIVGRDGEWEPPNVVFVIADDIGYGDLGCNGQEYIQTANLDRMADEGTRFTRCYTGSPVCAPSRSVLMTGQHAGHTRIRQNAGEVGGVHVVDDGPLQRRVPLGSEDPCLAEVFSEAGYVTGAFGKWGLGEAGTSGAPTRKGFDEWFGYLNQRRAHTYFPPYLWDGEERVNIEGNEDEGRTQHAQDLVMERALEFIKRHADDRFFCFLPATLPHSPYVVPDEESVAPYADEDWSADERAYAAMVTRLDADVGRILNLLADLGLDDETIVFFCSDHGPAQQFVEERFDSTGGLRGGKLDLYEGGIRTPMLVRWPGHVPADRTENAPWYYPDVLPTLAELAGVWPNPGVQAATESDGVSVLPTLLGTEQPLADRFLYWEFPHDGYGQAARYGKWKAIRQDVTAPIKLYDLDEDSSEEYDVADQHQDRTARFEWYLDQSHEPSPHWSVRIEDG